jgi:hypothetical protein
MKDHLTRCDVVEPVTRIELAWPVGRNLRACSSRLGCAFWSDLLAPRGTNHRLWLGAPEGPGVRLLFDAVFLPRFPEARRSHDAGRRYDPAVDVHRAAVVLRAGPR